jgi:uncharacterized SAM-binding protein YcdF (DUF218 family)
MKSILLRAIFVINLLIVAFLFYFILFYSNCLEHAQKAFIDFQSMEPAKGQEAIVVLTGDKLRIPKAIELLKNKKQDYLIISGTAKGISLVDLVNQQFGSAENVQQIWENIIIESASSSTLENALETKKILENKKIQSFILVTSDYHLYRAHLIFKKAIKIPFHEYPVFTENSLTLYFYESLKYLLYLFYYQFFI